MKPAPFSYRRVRSSDEAIELLGNSGPDAKVLAGGQSLIPLMNFRLARPAVLVDIGRLPGMSGIEESGGRLVIGALARQSDVEDSSLVRRACPLLHEATGLVGHRTIRNRGTVGGSLAHADPSAEYPAVLLALEGEVTAKGPRGERAIGARDLFRSVLATSLEPDELLTSVRLPVMPKHAGSAFVELSRRHGDYAIIGAAVMVVTDGGGRCTSARIALAGVASTPVRCEGAERLLEGTGGGEKAVSEAAVSCAAMVEPRGDLHASPQYRKAMTEVFVRRGLSLAFQRARAGRA